MNRKRSLRPLCMALCAALLFAWGAVAPKSVAYAAGNLDVNNLTVTPGSLPTSGGNVTLTGTLVNNTGVDVTSVTLQVDTYRLDIENTIVKGGSKDFSLQVTIGTSDVGREKMLTVDWRGAGTTAGTNTATFTVPLEEQTVSLSFTRTANNTKVQMGDTVKLTYNFKNTGTATITNLKLTDSCIDGTIVSGLTLNAGESYQKISSVVVNADISSVPKVEYTAAGSTKTKTLDALDIKLANADLGITASADKSQVNSGDTVTFSIVITNNSQVAVSGIKVTDDLGTIVRSDANIAATTGSTPKTLNITYPTTMTAGRAVSFTLTYPSGTGTGTKTSDPITISVMQAGSPLTLDVSASPVAMTTFPGDVTFTVTITNISGLTISNISVKEPTFGDIVSIVSLAPGGQSTQKKICRVTQAGTFTFTANGTGPNGTSVMAVTKQVSVTSQVGSPTPEVVQPSGSDTLHTLFIVMVVIVSLIVIAGIILAILIIQDRRRGGHGGGKRRRREEDWDEEDEQEEDQDEDVMISDVRPNRLPKGEPGRRISSMEHTQPILRTTGRPADNADTPQKRRAFTLEGDRDSFRARQSVVEEEESKVYGPVTLSDSQAEDAKRQAMRRPEFSEDRRPSRRARLSDEESSENLDQLYDVDMNVTSRRRRPPMSEQPEKPPVHLHYENEDDDLPPLRPRRRR